MIFEFPFLGSDFHTQLQFARHRIQTLWMERLSTGPGAVDARDLPMLKALAGRACDLTLLELEMPSRPVLRAPEVLEPSILNVFFDRGRLVFREVALALIEDVNDARELAGSITAVSEALERMRQRGAGTYRELLRAGSGEDARAWAVIAAAPAHRRVEAV